MICSPAQMVRVDRLISQTYGKLIALIAESMIERKRPRTQAAPVPLILAAKQRSFALDFTGQKSGTDQRRAAFAPAWLAG